MHAVSLDDAYRVERVLASGRGTVTEKVSLDGAGPFVRKKMPAAAANRGVWAAIASSSCRRLPHVVATYELPDQFVAVYEYVPGETLESRLAERGRLGRDEALAVALDVCEGVAALHSLGIMHRDISLANVVMAADGAHLIDLGNAQPIARPPEHVSTPFGTWGFAAPEQYGFAKTDVRSDVYSIGRLLGSLIAGVSPADGSYEKKLADDTVDPGLRAIVELACAFEPSARYQTVRDLQDALKSLKPKATKGPAATESAPRVKSKRAGLILAVAGTAIVAIALVAVFLLGRPQTGIVRRTADSSYVSPIWGDGGASTTSENSVGNSGNISEKELENALRVVDSGWFYDDGYLKYVVAIENVSADLTIEYPAVKVTGRAHDGSIAFASECAFWTIRPGETQYLAELCSSPTAPASVDFSTVTPDAYNVYRKQGSPCKFKVTNLSVHGDPYGGTIATGEIVTLQEGTLSYDTGSMVLSLVLRDDTGKIVYGSSNYCDRPDEGESTAFEIDAYGCPDYSTAEVYAIAW